MVRLSTLLKGKIKVGAAYYPEVTRDEEMIDDDISKMKELGNNVVRMGEFAWSSMETKEGEFDFSFFRHVMDKFYEAGIGVIFCTPSPTPPKWLTDKYEEILVFNERFSSCLNNPNNFSINITHANSINYKGLQIADIMAWSVFQSLEYDNSEFINLIRNKDISEVFKRY